MFKKSLIGSLIFLSSLFLFSDNAKAFDNSNHILIDYNKTSMVGNEYFNAVIEEVYEIANTLTNDYRYIISINSTYPSQFSDIQYGGTVNLYYYKTNNGVSFPALNLSSISYSYQDPMMGMTEYYASIIEYNSSSLNLKYNYCQFSYYSLSEDISNCTNPLTFMTENWVSTNQYGYLQTAFQTNRSSSSEVTDYFNNQAYFIYDTNLNVKLVQNASGTPLDIKIKNSDSSYGYVDGDDYNTDLNIEYTNYYAPPVISEPEPEIVPVTATEIFEKTGKVVSQSAIDSCYSAGLNYFIVYSEGTTSKIGTHSIMCSVGPLTYMHDGSKSGITENFGYHWYDSSNNSFNWHAETRKQFINGTTECNNYSDTCRTWGRQEWFTFYYSNYDILYNDNFDYASMAGEIKFACNADTCFSNEFYTPIIPPEPEFTYDYSYEISPYNHNYAYIKFKGIGDIEIYLNTIINSSTRDFLSYSIFKNGSPLFRGGILGEVNNYTLNPDYFNQYFQNSLDTDIYTIIFALGPTNSSYYAPSDTLTLNFSVPGLIEYGTDQNVYKIITDNSGDTSVVEDAVTDRSDITDLLDKPERPPEEITSDPSSTNTLTNDSLNEFSWPYSLFSRNGTNITDIKLTASYSNTGSLSINNFENKMIINYGSEVYKINLNNCMLNNACDLTNYEKTLIKQILFDRDVENLENYLSFRIKPLNNLNLSSSAQLNVGLSLQFSSSVELTISSFLLAINEISNSYYNVYFRLYDSAGYVHTLYKTALNGTDHTGVNQFLLEDRTADIYKVELMFVYNMNSNVFSTLDTYHLDFSEFNIFANTNLIHIYTDDDTINYRTCAWNDFFCHFQNGFTWLIREAPILKDFWTILSRITNIFDIIWTLLSYIFMPLDIIPPLFGVDISDIALSILALYTIVKLWMGGKSE